MLFSNLTPNNTVEAFSDLPQPSHTYPLGPPQVSGPGPGRAPIIHQFPRRSSPANAVSSSGPEGTLHGIWPPLPELSLSPSPLLQGLSTPLCPAAVPDPLPRQTPPAGPFQLIVCVTSTLTSHRRQAHGETEARRGSKLA